jgi:hypothetical protein
MWWQTPVIPALGRLKQEDCDFKASLGYRESSRTAWATNRDPPLKKQKPNKKKKK